jgi:DNA-binding response OmpR family regulator
VVVRGPLLIDGARHLVEVEGRDVPLTATEFNMLSGMAERPGQVFSRSQLLSMAQGEYFEGYERTVDTHIKNTRKKLGEKADDWEFIETVHGVGYRFNARKKT